MGVVPICSVFGPPFYITRCCPFTLTGRGQRSNCTSYRLPSPCALPRSSTALVTFVILTSAPSRRRVKRIIIGRRLIMRSVPTAGRKKVTGSDRAAFVLREGGTPCFFVYYSFENDSWKEKPKGVFQIEQFREGLLIAVIRHCFLFLQL